MYEKATNEELIQEATERLKFLQTNNHYKLHTAVVSDFIKDGKVNYSEQGILYWLSDKFLEAVNKVEAEFEMKVYHAVYNNTDMGEMLCCLIVSSDKSTWYMERRSLEEGYPFCYLINLTDSTFSEFGDTPMRGLFGGLLRTDIIYK